MKPDGSKEQALSPNQDETGRIYLQIKIKQDGSKEQDVSPNQDETGRI